MLTLALAAVLSQYPQHRLFLQPNLPRSADLPFFSAFDGLGTTTACSTTPPTGSRGETLTFTRASTATCTRTASGGLATTGIADGDLALMASGQPRVMFDSTSTLGLLVEAQGVNLLPRYNALTDAAWSDVGTPTVTDGATDPFGGTTGDTITDNDAAAYEGRTQTITVSAGVAHLAYCYVKAGTATTARIVLDGTAATITGLSPTTWSVLEVADASSSGVAIAVQVMVGNATTVTGTVVWGGCDVKAGTYRTSIVPTVGASATRVVESAAFNGLSISSAAGLSWAANVEHPSGNGGSIWGSGPALVQDASNRTQLYRQLSNVQTCDYISTSGTRTTGVTVIAAYVAGQSYRQACSYSGPGASSTVAGYRDGVLFATSAAGTTSAWTATSIIPGALGTATTTSPADSIVSRICVDTSPERCR